MKNPNVSRKIMFFIMVGGIVLAGISGVIWGVEPVHPGFVLGAVIAFGGLIYGIIKVRCPFCGGKLRMVGLKNDEFCPNCGRKFSD